MKWYAWAIMGSIGVWLIWLSLIVGKVWQILNLVVHLEIMPAIRETKRQMRQAKCP